MSVKIHVINLQRKKTILSPFSKKRQSVSGDKKDKRFGSVLKVALKDFSSTKSLYKHQRALVVPLKWEIILHSTLPLKMPASITTVSLFSYSMEDPLMSV